MTSKKTRHEFLADANMTAKLNELTKSGATKTETIIQAIKAFAEYGNEAGFLRLTAKRFDALSHEIEVVRRAVEGIRRDFESAQKDRENTQADMKTILGNLAFITEKVNAKLPPDSKEFQIPSRGFFSKFR